jgi:hypothetical protein
VCREVVLFLLCLCLAAAASAAGAASIVGVCCAWALRRWDLAVCAGVLVVLCVASWRGAREVWHL